MILNVLKPIINILNSLNFMLLRQKALNHGWLQTFDREWWTLQSDHLFKPIQSKHEFKALVQEHQVNVKKLAQQISLRLVD